MWVNVCSYHINSIVSAFVDAEHLRWRVLIVLGSFKARIMRDDQSVTAGKMFPVNLKRCLGNIPEKEGQQ